MGVGWNVMAGGRLDQRGGPATRRWPTSWLAFLLWTVIAGSLLISWRWNKRYFNNVPRARISGRLTSSRLVSSARTSAFLLARSTLSNSVASLLHTAR